MPPCSCNEQGRLVLRYCFKCFSRYEELRSYNLDIPKITDLFRELHDSGYNLPKTVLTVEEARDSILGVIDAETGGME